MVYDLLKLPLKQDLLLLPIFYSHREQLRVKLMALQEDNFTFLEHRKLCFWCLPWRDPLILISLSTQGKHFMQSIDNILGLPGKGQDLEGVH